MKVHVLDANGYVLGEVHTPKKDGNRIHVPTMLAVCRRAFPDAAWPVAVIPYNPDIAGPAVQSFHVITAGDRVTEVLSDS